MDSFLNSIETVAQEFISDAKAVADQKKSWSMFVDRYGHLRPGTYDITSETYAENIEKYLKPVVDQVKITEEEINKTDDDWLSEKESLSSAMTKIGIDVNSNTLESF